MQDAAAIDVRDLAYAYGSRRALDGITFMCAAGRICGLLGPNGSGKSTLFRILATLIRPQAGRASLLGLEVTTQAAEVRRRIGVVFQSPSLDKRLSAAENLRHHGHLHGLSGAPLRFRIAESLERVGMSDRAGERVDRLSGGQQRRVELAKGLMHRPAVLLLDEPSTGLDPAARRSFREQLHRLRDEDKISVLLTTHILEDAEACDHLVLLDAGRIVAQGMPSELKRKVSGDSLFVRTADPSSMAIAIGARLGIDARVVDGTVRIETPRGHELIARLVEAFGTSIESVTFAHATLEDVFIDRTGHRLESDLPVRAGGTG